MGRKSPPDPELHPKPPGGGRARSIIINSFNAITISASVILTYLQTGKSRLDSSVGQAMQPLAEMLPSFIYDHMGNANDMLLGIGLIAPIIFTIIESALGIGQIMISVFEVNTTKFTYYKTKVFEKMPLIITVIAVLLNIDIESTQFIKTLLDIQRSTPDLLDIPLGLVGAYGGYLTYKFVNTVVLKGLRETINSMITPPKTPPMGGVER